MGPGNRHVVFSMERGVNSVSQFRKNGHGLENEGLSPKVEAWAGLGQLFPVGHPATLDVHKLA